MKKLFLIISSLFVSLLINAQVTLENTYNTSATITRLENSGYKYYAMDVAASQCRLYNMNHSIYKTINLSVPGGQYLYDIIEYKLPDGVSEGSLYIIDIHGRIIDNYKIDRTFNNFRLNTVNYPKGTYICRLQANGLASDIQKFVVQ